MASTLKAMAYLISHPFSSSHLTQNRPSRTFSDSQTRLGVGNTGHPLTVAVGLRPQRYHSGITVVSQWYHSGITGLVRSFGGSFIGITGALTQLNSAPLIVFL